MIISKKRLKRKDVSADLLHTERFPPRLCSHRLWQLCCPSSGEWYHLFCLFWLSFMAFTYVICGQSVPITCDNFNAIKKLLFHVLHVHFSRWTIRVWYNQSTSTFGILLARYPQTPPSNQYYVISFQKFILVISCSNVLGQGLIILWQLPSRRNMTLFDHSPTLER